MKYALLFFALAVTPVFAQGVVVPPLPQVDPAIWPHVIQQLMQQRDAAMMANASAQVKVEQLTAELEKLKAKNEAAPDK